MYNRGCGLFVCLFNVGGFLLYLNTHLRMNENEVAEP